jgi:hypothetical protein
MLDLGQSTGVMMSEKRGLIYRLLTSTLFATSIGVTLVLVVIGYQLAIWILEQGKVTGNVSMAVLAAGPSLAALLSLPFWLTLQRMSQDD